MTILFLYAAALDAVQTLLVNAYAFFYVVSLHAIYLVFCSVAIYVPLPLLLSLRLFGYYFVLNWLIEMQPMLALLIGPAYEEY